jgi:iron complex transport system ATP-binding protein
MKGPILFAEHLDVGYKGEIVIGDIRLEAVPGQILTLIGPNGAGKSTILKTITRQLEPIGGSITLNGQDLRGMKERDIARTVAAVLTGRPTPELMTCWDVVSSGRYPYTGRLGILSQTDKEKTEEAMALVRVTELRERDFNQISDGQRQRVLLARAICQEPRVLIMDEPTSFLDIKHKLDFLTLLRELVLSRDLAVILSLHELDLAQRYADRILCVRDGRVDRLGTPEEIFTEGYIEELYGVERGSFDALFGNVESEAVPGEPEVFVIGGGGSGIPLYRRLQRLRIPFAAGVVHKGDLDWPVAKALGARVVAEEAYSPIGEEAYREAAETLLGCRLCLCPLERFGPMNELNRKLRDLAAEKGLLADPDRLEELRDKP